LLLLDDLLALERGLPEVKMGGCLRSARTERVVITKGRSLWQLQCYSHKLLPL
jgi:hypothetical protein